MDPKKQMKLSKTERQKRRKLKHGEVIPFKKGEHPVHNPRRKLYTLKCEVCGFPAHHRMYVCTKCGNCQACGALNIAGIPNQGCSYCGNGEKELIDNPPPEPETINTGYEHSDVRTIRRESNEVKPHKKKQSSATVSISNINE